MRGVMLAAVIYSLRTYETFSESVLKGSRSGLTGALETTNIPKTHSLLSLVWLRNAQLTDRAG